jgi:hypothetical protein
VLGPLDSAAKDRRYPVQFTLADFLCLFVQIQLALAGPAVLFRGVGDKGPAVIMTVFIILFVLLVWWTGVRTLSRAGVHDTRGRTLTLVVAIPFGYAVSVAIPVVGCFILGSLANSPGPGRSRDEPSTAILILIELAILFSAWALGIMTRRILRTANPPPKTTPLQDLVRLQQADNSAPPRTET